MRASQQVRVVSRRLESEVVVLVLVDRFLCFIVDVRVARLVLLVLVRLYVEVDFGDLDSERLEVLGQGACLFGLCTAGEATMPSGPLGARSERRITM